MNDDEAVLMTDRKEAQETRGRLNSPTLLKRREALKLAGTLGLAAAVGAVAEACGKTVVPTATPTIAPIATAVPTSTPAPAATATSSPTSTPKPTPTDTPVPIPTPTAVKPLSTQHARIAHLLRRAGFGASQQDMDRFESMGLSATVDYLVDYEKADNTALEAKLQPLKLDLTKLPDLQRWWLLRMVYTQRPLQEKMVLFWHGLLTSGNSRVGRPERMWKQNELFREQALGRYDVLLKAVSRDPAMLVWLDSQSNKKSAPNENFARELMELFSMGVGNYTEQDVRESARAFTGYSLNSQGFVFNPSQHDAGSKTFLGVQGPLAGEGIIDIIMKQPATSHFVCRRLFSFFAYDNPEAEVLSKLGEAFVGSGHSVKTVMRELLSSEAFYSERAFRSRPKSPAELVAGAFRSLGMETDGAGLPRICTRMGQTLFDPPNVAGWPGGPAWLNSSTLLERVNFANRVATDRRAFRPAEVMGGARTPQETADYLVALLLYGVIAPGRRAVLHEYALSALKMADTDAALRSLAYLVLASPDYQLA